MISVLLIWCMRIKKMNEQVKKIYDFVLQMEDSYYSKLTCGENLEADLMNTAQASSFQRVRYFIEEMLECSTEKGNTE